MTAPWLELELGPGVRAGLTTVAAGNLGLAVGDDPALVAERRRAVADRAGGPIAWARQVHGAQVWRVSVAGDDVAACDAMVATGPVGLAVLVADCVPVLLADPAARVIGVAHAGRLGVLAGVVPAAVRAMREAGAGQIRAVVGPAICGACYEVPAALREDVAAKDPDLAATTSWGTPSLDLPGAVVRALVADGVAVQHLDVCTRTDPRFFSHRSADQGLGAVGRFAGIVRLD